MSGEVAPGRCERCGAWASNRVNRRGWYLHPECAAPSREETNE